MVALLLGRPLAQFTTGLLSQLGTHDLALALLRTMLAALALCRLVTLPPFELPWLLPGISVAALTALLALVTLAALLATGATPLVTVRLATLLAVRLPATLLSPLAGELLAGVGAARLALPATLLRADGPRRPLALLAALAALAALRLARLLAALTPLMSPLLSGRLPLLASLAVSLLAERLAGRFVTLGLAARLLLGASLLALFGAHTGLLAPARLPRLVALASLLLAVKPLVRTGLGVTSSLSITRAVSLTVRIVV